MFRPPPAAENRPYENESLRPEKFLSCIACKLAGPTDGGLTRKAKILVVRGG